MPFRCKSASSPAAHARAALCQASVAGAGGEPAVKRRGGADLAGGVLRKRVHEPRREALHVFEQAELAGAFLVIVVVVVAAVLLLAGRRAERPTCTESATESATETVCERHHRGAGKAWASGENRSSGKVWQAVNICKAPTQQTRQSDIFWGASMEQIRAHRAAATSCSTAWTERGRGCWRRTAAAAHAPSASTAPARRRWWPRRATASPS